MRLSVYTDYALRLLMHTAARDPERVTIDEIAGVFRISRNHLVKAVYQLGLGGYLKTHRGRRGGFTLGMAPADIRIGELVRHTESSLVLVECFDLGTNQCRLFPACRLRGMLSEAMQAFFSVLDQHTLADLVAEPGEIRKALSL